MSRNNPEQHETAKHQITGELAYVEVSNHLRQLQGTENWLNRMYIQKNRKILLQEKYHNNPSIP